MARASLLRKGMALFRMVSELVAKDPKTARRVAEPPGDLGGRVAFKEKGPQRFILPMERLLGCRKEARPCRPCYLITMSDDHIYILLHPKGNVNP